jgi:hypothetical protein
MPKMAERKNKMTITCSTCPALKSTTSPNADASTDSLTLLEMAEIALYTVQKINNYPKSLGKTVENYFHLLYPDEIKSYLMRRMINEKSFRKTHNNPNLSVSDAGEEGLNGK